MDEKRTSAGLGQLRQPQQGVVTGDRLKGDVRVPLVLAALAVFAAGEGALKAVGVEFLGLLGRDDGDLVVVAAVLAGRVADGVDVQAGRLGLAGQLAETVDKLLLQVIREVVLGAEKNDTPLGDWRLMSINCLCQCEWATNW